MPKCFITCTNGRHLFINLIQNKFFLQGRPGDKGQKGDSGNPEFDVYWAVKVNTIESSTYLKFLAQ